LNHHELEETDRLLLAQILSQDIELITTSKVMEVVTDNGLNA
jgi:hypothetical protein